MILTGIGCASFQRAMLESQGTMPAEFLHCSLTLMVSSELAVVSGLAAKPCSYSVSCPRFPWMIWFDFWRTHLLNHMRSVSLPLVAFVGSMGWFGSRLILALLELPAGLLWTLASTQVVLHFTDSTAGPITLSGHQPLSVAVIVLLFWYFLFP